MDDVSMLVGRTDVTVTLKKYVSLLYLVIKPESPGSIRTSFCQLLPSWELSFIMFLSWPELIKHITLLGWASLYRV